jgi:tetratricopeptide (TPR) repeat protein
MLVLLVAAPWPWLLPKRAGDSDPPVQPNHSRTQSPRFPGVDTLKRANNQAVALARRGNYRAALPMLQRAGLTNDTIRYNLALVELALHHPERAARLLRSTPGFKLAGLNLGVAECQAGDYENGLLDLSTALHTAEAADELAYNKGLANLRLNALDGRNNVGTAEQHLREAVRLNPSELRYRMTRGDALMAQRRYEEALKSYRQALDETSHPALYARLGQAALATRQYEKAVEAFEDYLRSPDRGQQFGALLGLAHAAYCLEQYPKALLFYKKAIQVNPASVKGHTGLGNTLCSEHKYRDAARAYDQALHLDSTAQLAHLGRAIACFRLGEFKAAVGHFRRAGDALDPSNRDHFDFFVSRGFAILRAGGRGQEAEPFFLTALKLNPKSPVAWAGLSEAHIKAQSFTAALDYAEQALKRERTNDRLLTNRANLLLKFDYFDRAHQTFAQAVSTNPRNVNALNGLGVTLLEMDEMDAALHLYDSLITRTPRAFLYNNRGIVKSYLGLRNEKAKEHRRAQNFYHLSLKDFQKAQEMDSARRFYNNNAGNVYKNIQDFDNAVRCYEAYLSKTAINNMGVLFANASKEKASQHYLNVAIKIDSSNFIFLYNRSKLYRDFFRDSLRSRQDIQEAGRLINQLPQNSIASRYSKDGYITIYLFDYEYDKYEFPGEHRFPVEPEVSEQNEFLPVLAFVDMPADQPTVAKAPVATHVKVRNFHQAIRRSRRWGSTKCPAL